MAATPIGFFGLKLVPGKVHRMDVSRDFKITNVSYADAPKSSTKTLVKIHYTHVPGFEDDYNEDEDVDESEDAENEEEIEEKVYTLCSLNGNNKDHAVVDLQFCQEELIGFSITGDAAVDLVGNYVAPPDFFDQEPSDSELYSDDEDDEDMYDLDSDEFDEDDEDDVDMENDAERFEELVESKPKKAIAAAPVAESKKRVAEKPVKETAAKKLKSEAAATTTSATSTPTKAATAKVEKQTKSPKELKTKTETPEKKTVEKPAKMTTTKLPSGLVIEEKSAGSGPPCKSGQKVGMRYVGKLTNGKVFDQCTSGKPFYFKLGKGEVIKGWDEGVKGMKVGAERRLTCPAKLAYGNQKLPGIPANSTLMFDVKLVEIK